MVVKMGMRLELPKWPYLVGIYDTGAYTGLIEPRLNFINIA